MSPHSQNIICPSCKSEIAITDAVAQQLREELRREFAEKEKISAKLIADRERQIQERESTLARERESLDEAVRKRLDTERRKLTEQAQKSAQEQLGVEMQDLRQQLAERAEKLKAAQGLELELRKQQRALEERSQEMELEVKRTLDKERSAIREEQRAQALEEQRLRLAEKEKIIGDMQKQIDALKQKSEQGSTQLQGEVLELDIEQQLRLAFPHDTLEPVAKGHRGGDVLQRVRTNGGQECGSVLWEAKRTKTWSKEWIMKLKEDQREAKAEVAVIITRVLPPEMRGFGCIDGVWICEFTLFLAVAESLRQGLVMAAVAKQSEVGRHGKMELLYDYLAGTEFRQRVEAIVEAFKTLKDDLDAERRAMERQWAKRERQITNVIRNTAQMYGGIQGIIGSSMLPEIGALALDSGNEAPPLALETQQAPP